MPTNPHEQDVKDLYNRLPKAYSGVSSTDDIRLINYVLFESMIGQMMDKAYYYGQINAVESVENIIETTFK